LPYDLVCDGQDVDLGAQKYLLSPQDLAAYDLVPELAELGIRSLKIEGRLKSPEYVANITSHYRRAIDAAYGGRRAEFTPRDVAEMELSFSRGFSHGWLGGCDHKMLVPALSSAKRGIHVGQVQSVCKGRVRVRLCGPLKRGDGVVFEGDRATGAEQGGRIYEIYAEGKSLAGAATAGEVELGFGHDAIDLGQIRLGQSLWKTDDPELTARLRRTFTAADPVRRVPLDLEIEAAVGAVLRVVGRTATGVECRLESREPLAAAIRHPLTSDVLRKQFGRLGGSVYQLRNVECLIDGEPMAPLSVLGELRHALIAQLDAALRRLRPRAIASGDVLGELRTAAKSIAADHELESAPPTTLWVLCRTLDQLQPVLSAGVRRLYADFQDIRQYREAIGIAHAAGAEIFLATPRIQKPDEPGIFRVLARYGADGILCRNLGAMAFFAE
jgi:putative protease